MLPFPFSYWQSGVPTFDAPFYTFNGTNQYVDLGLRNIINAHTYSAITVSCVFRYDGQDNYIITRWGSGSNSCYLMRTRASNDTIQFTVRNSSFTNVSLITSTSFLTVGQLYSVVGIWDGTNATLCVDGIVEAGPTALAGPLLDTPWKDLIGSRLNGAVGQRKTGDYYNVQFWKTDWTLSDAAFYHANPFKDPSTRAGTSLNFANDCVAYFEMTEDSDPNNIVNLAGADASGVATQLAGFYNTDSTFQIQAF